MSIKQKKSDKSDNVFQQVKQDHYNLNNFLS